MKRGIHSVKPGSACVNPRRNEDPGGISGRTGGYHAFSAGGGSRVADTAPAVHSQQDNTWKEAALDTGARIQVPLFVEPGEIVRVEVETGRYLERVRLERKRGVARHRSEAKMAA